MTKDLLPPCAYQGGKRRYARKIVEVMNLDPAHAFADVCCGSGAVALAAVLAGVSTQHITMVDAGPWGRFWREVGSGAFDLAGFDHYLNSAPRNPRNVKLFLQDIAQQRAEVDTSVVFLLLQAGSYGARAVWQDGVRWVHQGFRTYLDAAHLTTSPDLPVLRRRVHAIANMMYGVRGVEALAEGVSTDLTGTVYVDPPYEGTKTYGFSKPPLVFPRADRWFVSEARPLSDRATLIAIAKATRSINANKHTVREEWLSEFSNA